MSWRQAERPVCRAREGSVELVIEPREKDLGELIVRRVLPAPDRQMVGPFIFFDHMGPAEFGPGQGIDVRPHPHIGLATVTFLFEGEILHRDSLGCVQPIEPGAINLMTAGRGIVHSERTSEARLATGQRLHGIQTWMALPDGREEIDPGFVHVPAQELPAFEDRGARGRVILGESHGVRSPVATEADTLYLHVELAPGGRVELPADVPEMAVYVVEGDVKIGDCPLGPATMGVLAGGSGGSVSAEVPARIMVCGGETIGPRHIDWNFVSSTRERIEQARRDWSERRFASIPGDDEEFIPLPEGPRR